MCACECRRESDHLCFITLVIHLIRPAPVRERERDVDHSQLNISCFKQLLSEILRDFRLNGVHQSPEQSPLHFCIHLVSFDTFFML